MSDQAETATTRLWQDRVQLREQKRDEAQRQVHIVRRWPFLRLRTNGLRPRTPNSTTKMTGLRWRSLASWPRIIGSQLRLSAGVPCSNNARGAQGRFVPERCQPHTTTKAVVPALSHSAWPSRDLPEIRPAPDAGLRLGSRQLAPSHEQSGTACP